MRRDQVYWDGELNRAGRRISAAQGVMSGRFEEFMAALHVGCDEERRQCREAVLSAHEALLDAFEFNAWLLLEKSGIDPRRRHL